MEIIKTMTFEQKVKSMKPSEIVMAMVNGLRKKHVNINMRSLGHTKNGICFGCAATNTICEINKQKFDNFSIGNVFTRAEFLQSDVGFLSKFEFSIDALRKGKIQMFNKYLEIIGIKTISIPYILNHLTSNFDESDLIGYEQYAKDLQEHGY